MAQLQQGFVSKSYHKKYYKRSVDKQQNRKRKTFYHHYQACNLFRLLLVKVAQGNHQYDTNYGLSESIGPGCVHLGVENIHKVGAIGKAGYGWEVKIADPDGNTVKRGKVGELYVKGPGVMTCYYRDEKATAETLKDGWLLTGDMAQEDEDGFIYLVDRKKDVIISGGENLYPVQMPCKVRSSRPPMS